MKLPHFNVLARWRRVFLYPLLLKVSKNEPEPIKDLNAITKDIISIMARKNDAAQRTNLEVDDDF